MKEALPISTLQSGAVATAADDFDPAAIISLERSALDVWAKGDPTAFLALFAPEATYFDPYQKRRVDGFEALNAILGALAGSFTIACYEITDPKVERLGNAALLTFNLVNYEQDGRVMNRWNSTEVYRRIDGRWRIIHSHWSYTTPELKQAASQ